MLEYVSGGELLDHILAHRYLKEKDARKLFSQLISAIWYIHQKEIVHRNLNLENLLLDWYKNMRIVGFGFANQFQYKTGDLMQTSCGSLCYAAPELVVSDGVYVGSAVDIWSCGVILYAMLVGRLPFDDDPANPDRDDIKLLYEYIVNTPLSFPDHVSPEARDLLSLILVPDPQNRANIQTVMDHRWLRPEAALFNRTLEDLERVTTERRRQKRLDSQRRMKAAAVEQQQMTRSQDIPLNNDATPTSTSKVTAPTSDTRKEPNAGDPPNQGQGKGGDGYGRTIQVESGDNPTSRSQKLSRPWPLYHEPHLSELTWMGSRRFLAHFSFLPQMSALCGIQNRKSRGVLTIWMM